MRKTHLALWLAATAVTLASCTKTERTYYPDGRLQSVIQYKFGKENGKSYYMYRNPNTLEIEIEMRHGKRNGEFHRYFQNGNLDTYCVYVNDSIEGVEVMFTPNGEKKQESTYTHGKRNGPHKEYHVNGQVKVEGSFKDDLPDGDWTYYDDRGVIVGEGHFKNGAGAVTSYDAMGRVARVTNYVGSHKEGKETFYTPAGEVYKETLFKQDRIVSQQADSTLMP